MRKKKDFLTNAILIRTFFFKYTRYLILSPLFTSEKKMYQSIVNRDFLYFKNRCYREIRKINATGAIWVNERVIFDRFCKLNGIASACSNSDLFAELSDKDLYFGLLIAFGSVINEIL